MAAFDMGGPVNKTATAFTLALMAEGIYGPNGAYRIACAIPPLGIASQPLFPNVNGLKMKEEWEPLLPLWD
jgi:PTS system fructose-specific IIC component/fructose-specific PTS system IIC-like component